MDNELLSAKIAAMEAKSPLARRRSRREPDGLAFHVSLLWPGAGLARVEGFARRRVSLPQGNAIACDRPSPGPIGPCPDADLADHIRREIEASDFHGEGLSQTMGATAR